MTYEEWLRQNVGQPIEQGAKALAAPIDAATDARIRAAQQIAAQQQMQAAPHPMPSQQYHANPALMTGAEPGMGGGESSVPLTPDASLRRQAALKAMYNQPKEQDLDPSQYNDVPTTLEKEAANRFAGLQKKIQNQKPINSKDIKKATDPRDEMAGQGMQEFTPDLAKKLGYEDQEE